MKRFLQVMNLKITETKDKFMSVGEKKVVIYRSGAEDIPYEEVTTNRLCIHFTTIFLYRNI